MTELTPAEKAIELRDKFMPHVYCYVGSGMLANDYSVEEAQRNAKACALIAVKFASDVLAKTPYGIDSSAQAIELNDMKIELEKL